MSKDPAFLFYSADFLVGTMDLTDEETGQYIKLICLQHQKGRLSEKSILRMFPTISEDVLAKFEVDENGLYYNPRVEEEIEKRNAFVEARRENGAKGGRPKKPNENLSENENINENINNSNIDNNLYFQRFDIFWEKYPKKRDKAKAQKSFLRLKPSDELLSQMLNAIEQQKRTKQWQDKEFIPYPSTWLNGERWNDEVGGGGYDYNDIPDAFKVGEYI